MTNNNFIRAFLIILFGLGALLLYELAQPILPFFSYFEPTHFWTAYDSSQSSKNSVFVDLQDLMAEDSDNIGETAIDSIDSLQRYSILPDSILTVLPNKDDYKGWQHLAPFFQALRDLQHKKRKRVRIAWYGDSTSDSDIGVGTLRLKMQQKFGGQGVGYIPVSTSSPAYRKTVQQRFSKNWVTKAYRGHAKNVEFNYGISGAYHSSKKKSVDKSHWLKFSPAKKKRWTSSHHFPKAFLYYGQILPKNDSTPPVLEHPVQVETIIDGVSTNILLNQLSLVNRASLADSPSTNIELYFNFPQRFPIYGVSFESETGVLVDNFARRSDSGSNFHRIETEVIQQFDELLGGYDLVVLQFGPNVLHGDVESYKFYTRKLLRTIKHLRRALPHIPILIIGNPDRAVKIKGKMQTEPAVYRLVEAQKEAAIRGQAGFLDLFTAMGGEGSMVNWVTKSPQKASNDYLHFNHVGGDVVGGIFFNYFMDGLENRLIDSRDGRTYAIVPMGSQIWMAENLNYNSRKDCFCYNEEHDNCEKYGRLYTWQSAQNACPKGWHLPSDQEWKKLASHLGGYSDWTHDDAGEKGNSKDSYQQLRKAGNGAFTDLLAGWRDKDSIYSFLGSKSHYWSRSPYPGTEDIAIYWGLDGGEFSRKTYFSRGALSCRCVKDESTTN